MAFSFASSSKKTDRQPLILLLCSSSRIFFLRVCLVSCPVSRKYYWIEVISGLNSANVGFGFSWRVEIMSVYSWWIEDSEQWTVSYKVWNWIGCRTRITCVVSCYYWGTSCYLLVMVNSKSSKAVKAVKQ